MVLLVLFNSFGCKGRFMSYELHTYSVTFYYVRNHKLIWHEIVKKSRKRVITVADPIFYCTLYLSICLIKVSLIITKTFVVFLFQLLRYSRTLIFFSTNFFFYFFIKKSGISLMKIGLTITKTFLVLLFQENSRTSTKYFIFFYQIWYLNFFCVKNFKFSLYLLVDIFLYFKMFVVNNTFYYIHFKFKWLFS